MPSQFREVLAGALSLKIGCKPKVESPGPQQTLLLFIEGILPLIKDKPIFRRDNVVVLPYAERARLEPLKPSTFRSWLDRYMACTRETLDDKTGEWNEVVKSIPKDVAEAVISSEDFWPHLREVVAVNPVPRPSIASPGAPLVLLVPGYDDETQTITFKSCKGSYDESQTLMEATLFIRNLLKDFPFSDWQEGGELPESRSMAVQLAGMLSQFAANCVPRDSLRMGFVANANAQRSGKSLLLKIMIIPVNGKMSVQSWTSKDEDLRKVIDSELLRASNYIVFDNVKGQVQSQVLEGLMTSPNWTGRILGKSEMFEASNTASCYFSGNDIKMSGDMQNRCLYVDLYVSEASVQDREVANPIDDAWLMVDENRNKILTALWTIVREWDKAGRPKPTSKPRLGFENWCNVIAGMVEFCGFGDCLLEPELENAGDNESRDINQLMVILSSMEEWVKHEQADRLDKQDITDPAEMPPRLEYTFREISNISANAGLFEWLITGKETLDIDGNFESIELDHDAVSRFGKMLRRYAPIEKARTFRIGAQRTVRLSCTGKNRQRKYVIDF